MSVARTARRRRRQHKIKFRHLPPMDRPHYSAKDPKKSERQKLRAIENAKRGIK